MRRRLGLTRGDRLRCRFQLNRLRLSGGPARRLGYGSLSAQAPAHQQSLVVLQRAGMCFLLRDAEFRKHFDDGVRLYFQLPGQLVDANFTHTLRLRRELQCGRVLRIF